VSESTHLFLVKGQRKRSREVCYWRWNERSSNT